MGRLTRDPETRTTPSGKSVTSFSLAIDRMGADDQADFFNITAWEKTGELVQKYLAKGRRVLVQGRLRQDSWDDKQTGKKRSNITVVANDVTFLDGPSASSNTASDNAATADEPVKKPSDKDVVIEDIDDDKPIDLSEIPF